MGFNFNKMLEFVMEELKNLKPNYSKQDVYDVVDKVFKDWKPNGAEIVQYSKFRSKLQKAEDAKEAIMIISETWTV